ncbi:DUF2087 domain-containing protein [uncultured Dubosiella sp.]|uniref:DUF2087 domain-containing protein n=2 Tax=uncultured Dubosiella sp. TaxID=1937011 RepID=UPI0025B4FD49|nr:DUF2087 domain-containing protein [uncultured Dubosiella sp.]
MDFSTLTYSEIKHGYVETKTGYQCIYCEFSTNKDEIYPYENKFYTALGMMKLHLRVAHRSNLDMLLDLPKKDSGLSAHQVELIRLLHEGYADRDIAQRLGIKESTVRYQRFTLKEKEKQCKIYLAVMENLRQKPDSNFLAIHSTARQVDERYIATKEDEEKVKQDFFLSLDPLKLKSIPRKEKYKIIVLRILCETLTQKNYTEKQLNDILQPVYEDFASLRRCLIEYGFFSRDFSGQTYTKLI